MNSYDDGRGDESDAPLSGGGTHGPYPGTASVPTASEAWTREAFGRSLCADCPSAAGSSRAQSRTRGRRGSAALGGTLHCSSSWAANSYL